MARPRRIDRFGWWVMHTECVVRAVVVVVASLLLANGGWGFAVEQPLEGESDSVILSIDPVAGVSEEPIEETDLESRPSSTLTRDATLSPPENVSVTTDGSGVGSNLQSSEELPTPVAMQDQLAEPHVVAESTVVSGGYISDLSEPPVEWVIEEEAPNEVVVVPAAPKKDYVVFSDWLGYNATKSNTTWLADGDFGMFSLESFPTLDLGQDAALSFGTGFHFVNGPLSPDVPPRLFDFQLAYHTRKQVSAHSMWDVKVGVGAFSDFEGSARKGVRFPGHAVTYYEWDRECVSVFGVEVLDRDDISVLPVAGFVWQPRCDLVYELVFPRPKMRVQLNNNRAMYVAGELGGGTWAIKRPDFGNDNFTYRDLRVTFGIMEFGKKSDGALEIGWAFDRHLEFRSGAPVDSLDSALILRCQTHY